MARTPGSGRQSGTQNRLTTAFKDAVQWVYQDIGGNAAFAEWARRNQTEFFKIASKLIPAELNVKTQQKEQIVIIVGGTTQEIIDRRAARRAAEAAGTTFEQAAPARLGNDG